MDFYLKLVIILIFKANLFGHRTFPIPSLGDHQLEWKAQLAVSCVASSGGNGSAPLGAALATPSKPAQLPTAAFHR